MSRIVELAIPNDIGDLVLKGEIKPDFKIFTAAAQAESDKPVVHMIGSSTVRDLQGDTMTVNALADMCKIAPMLSVFLNHSYNLPQDLFGSIIEPPMLVQQDGIADLHLTVEVEMINDAAAKTLGYIRNGRRLGCSVGCMITKYEVADEEDGDQWYFYPLIIHGVYVVEFSVVSIPANQRSWVDNALKGAFAHTLDYRLAPAMKSLWSNDFKEIVQGVSDASLRKQLLEAPTRPGGDARITWEPNSKSFIFSNKGRTKSVSASEASALIEKHAAPPLLKSVCGKTSWPLASLETEWTGSKAKSQIFEYAGGDEFTPSKAKQGFLLVEDDKDDTRGAYHMPFCYKSGDGLEIVPLGVRACANVLSGGMGGVSASDEEKSGMKAKCKTMYGRINSTLKPDPKWEVPWEKEDKAVEDDFLFIDHVMYRQNADGDFVISKAEGLTNMDKEEEKSAGCGCCAACTGKADCTCCGACTARKALEIGEDGNHEKFTGTHTHAHKAFGSQGDDEMHKHSHPHENDASHRHPHEENKAFTINEDGTHEPFTGTHTHDHKAYGHSSADEDGMHGHEHPHDGDANHGHEHTDAYALDAAQSLLLAHYNNMGAALGLPEVTPAHVLSKAHPVTVRKELDMQNIVTCVSSIDQLSDALEEKVDYLMLELGIPDYDDDDAGEESGEAPAGATPYTYALATRFVKRALELVRKEGREFSTENMATIQLIHDALNDMTGGKVCGARGNSNSQGDGMSVEDAERDAADAMGVRPLTDAFAGFAKSIEKLTASTGAIDAVLKALAGLNIKDLTVDVQKAQTTLNMIKRDTAATYEEAHTVAGVIRTLKALPLGRPTALSRSVEETTAANTVTYAQLSSIEDSIVRGTQGAQSPDEALALTIIVKERLANGQEIEFREWPPTARNRPALTGFQKALMRPSDIVAYNNGEVAHVPVSPTDLLNNTRGVSA